MQRQLPRNKVKGSIYFVRALFWVKGVTATPRGYSASPAYHRALPWGWAGRSGGPERGRNVRRGAQRSGRRRCRAHSDTARPLLARPRGWLPGAKMEAASRAGQEISLAALKQHDPYITSIADVTGQVALYSFSPKANEWVSGERLSRVFRPRGGGSRWGRGRPVWDLGPSPGRVWLGRRFCLMRAVPGPCRSGGGARAGRAARWVSPSVVARSPILGTAGFEKQRSSLR